MLFYFQIGRINKAVDRHFVGLAIQHIFALSQTRDIRKQIQCAVFPVSLIALPEIFGPVLCLNRPQLAAVGVYLNLQAVIFQCVNHTFPFPQPIKNPLHPLILFSRSAAPNLPAPRIFSKNAIPVSHSSAFFYWNGFQKRLPSANVIVRATAINTTANPIVR